MRAQKILQTFGAGPLNRRRWLLASFAFRVVVHHRLMPDSAVNPARSSVPATSADDPAVTAPRTTRPAQREATPNRAPYGAPTLDLFAEDAERATLQALNTDIRQTTLPGFELPDVFMAAVSAASTLSVTARRVAVSDDAVCAIPDSAANGMPAPTLDLTFDDPHADSRKSSPNGD
jgi:hypothetical protein